MIQLLKMSQIDFEDYLNIAIPDYAQDKITAGAWAEEEAQQLSKETFNRLLSDGVNTENQFLFSIFSEKTEKVGYVWFQSSESLLGKTAFILDFIIFEQYRGKGYGKQTLLLLEVMAKELGINKMALHVFAHNATAIALYEKVGYENTDITMAKNL